MKKFLFMIFITFFSSLLPVTGTPTRMSQRAANAIEQAMTQIPAAVRSQVGILIDELKLVNMQINELALSLCREKVESNNLVSCLKKEAELTGFLIEDQMLRTSLANLGLQDEVEKFDKLMTDPARDATAHNAIFAAKIQPQEATPTLQFLSQGLQNPELYAGQVAELESLIQMLMQRIDGMKNNSCQNVNPLDPLELTMCIKNEAQVAGLEKQLLVLHTGFVTLTTRVKDPAAASRAQYDTGGISVQQDALRESGIPASQVMPLLPFGLSNELIPMGKY